MYESGLLGLKKPFEAMLKHLSTNGSGPTVTAARDPTRLLSPCRPESDGSASAGSGARASARGWRPSWPLRSSGYVVSFLATMISKLAVFQQAYISIYMKCIYVYVSPYDYCTCMYDTSIHVYLYKWSRITNMCIYTQVHVRMIGNTNIHI